MNADLDADDLVAGAFSQTGLGDLGDIPYREPLEVLVESLNRDARVWTPVDWTIDEPRYGREWTAFEELVLLRGLGVRDSVGNDDERFYDLHYHELMADSVGVVADILDHFGLPFDAGSRQAVERWIRKHPRTKYGVHNYTAQQFGLDPDRLRRRFAPYMDRFDVRREAVG